MNRVMPLTGMPRLMAKTLWDSSWIRTETKKRMVATAPISHCSAVDQLGYRSPIRLASRKVIRARMMNQL